jgi:hypothetical protein
MEGKSLQWKHLPPAGPSGPFRLTRTATGFMQVGLNNRWRGRFAQRR